jgi:hypothetical protein
VKRSVIWLVNLGHARFERKPGKRAEALSN